LLNGKLLHITMFLGVSAGRQFASGVLPETKNTQKYT